jgi:hypothetical protein
MEKTTVEQDPHDIRLSGKGMYKGRLYYAGAVTKDGLRIRLLTLPSEDGKYIDFWAPTSAVEIIKHYRPRQRTYRGRTITQHITLGSIAEFIRDQKSRVNTGLPTCPECGKRTSLRRDMEDGQYKCQRCCDMPE